MPIEKDELVQVLDVQVLGFATAHNNVQTLVNDFKLLGEAKRAASSAGGAVVDSALIDRVNRSLADLRKQQDNASTQNDKTASTLVTLIDNLEKVQNEIKGFGTALDTNTEKIKLATEQAALYANELDRIVAALKETGGKLPTLPSNSPTSRAPAQTQQTAEQVREVAEAYAQERDNVAAAGVAFQEFAASAELATTPLQEQTGSLSRNIALYNQNRTAIADVRAQMAQLTANTSVADRQGAAYQSRIAQLTGQERQFVQANKDLNTTINAQIRYTQAAAGTLDQLRAELVLARIAYDSLTDDVKKSDFGKGLLSNVQTLNAQVTAGEQITGRFQRNVGNYASAAFGYIKQIAYILPGLGIAGIFNLLFEGIGKLVDVFSNIGTKINVVKENLKNFTEVTANANKSIAEQKTQLDLLFSASQNSLLPIEDRIRAIDALQKLFPEYFGNLTQEQILNGQIGDSYRKLTIDIEANARALAANSKIVELESRKLDLLQNKGNVIGTKEGQISRAKGILSVDASGDDAGVTNTDISKDQEIKAIKERARLALIPINKAIEAIEKQENFLKNFAGIKELTDQAVNKVLGKQKVGLEELEQQYKKLLQTISVTAKNDPGYQALLIRRDQLKKEIADIRGTQSKGKGDSLGDANTNALNLIDADLKQALSENNIAYNAIRKQRELTFDEERQNLENILRLNEQYGQRKIDAIKGNNTKEIQARAAIREQLSNLEVQTQKQIEGINKKQFEDKLNDIKLQTEQEKAALQQQYQAVASDPTVSNTAKVQAKLDLDRQLLSLQVSYNIEVNALELQLRQHSEKNARERGEALLKLETDLLNDRRLLAQAQIKDIQDNGDALVLQTSVQFGRIRQAVLDNDKISQSERQKQLDSLDRAARVTLLSKELESLNKEVALKKQLYKQNLVSNEEYLAAVKKQQDKAGQLQGATTANDLGKQTGVQKFLGKELTVKGADGKAVGIGITTGEILAQGYDLARAAMNEYFDAEAARVAAGREVNLQRIDDEITAEKKRAQARGAGQAELDAIDRDGQKKKDQLTKEAGEKLKKIKKEELAVSLASELANIAAQAAGNIANSATFGVAGAIQYAILSTVALARNALLLSQINRQQFAEGGTVPTRGGWFRGRRHSQGGIPFSWRGQEFEAEHQEIAIVQSAGVNQNQQYNMRGTWTQIAGALNRVGGNPNFAPGAFVQRFAVGGTLGGRLQAPQYTPSSTAMLGAVTGDFLQGMQQQNALLLKNVESLQNMVLNIRVYQTPRDVSTSLTNYKKVNSLGRL